MYSEQGVSVCRKALNRSSETEIEYAIDIKTVLDIYHIDVEQIEGGIISSVVPQVTNAAKLALEKILKKM